MERRAQEQQRRRREPPARQRHRQRGGPAQPAAHPRHRRARDIRRSADALRRMGPEHRSHRQARGGDRLGRQRLSAGARGRQGGGQALRVPAFGALDAAQPALPRGGQPAVPLAGGARALLRALVPLPHILPGKRRDPAGAAHRQELGAPGAFGERHQRSLPLTAHRVHEEPGEWRCRAAGESHPEVSLHGQAHAAGQRQLAARAAAAECGADR